ncbi:hypothetical protein FH972_024443 [Carpinus fangiana]|uniref:J domain-containing protein n=1 Tax=Carpinus fangiana TaxID=176857 RepID=A0A5N6KYY8_9ROSI|nr:hypothetical protein FH972_024443 [Carpinus fangiana]
MASTTEEQKEDDRAHRDLVSYAKSLTADLYELLDLPSPFTQPSTSPPPSSDNGPSDAQLNRAWRRAALKYHPDKNRGDEKAAADKLDEARRAWQVLKDPEARAAYEGKRRAETERRQREQALEGRRRGLAEALRRGEEAAATPGSGAKRGFGDVGSPAGDEKAAKLRRLEEEGRRRRMEFVERARQRREDAAEAQIGGAGEGRDTPLKTKEEASVPELDRTVKVRWPRESAVGDAITSDTLRGLFKRFGAVESAAMLKDKKARPSVGSPLAASVGPATPGEKEKKARRQVMASGVVMFESIVAAHAAVHDALLVAQKEGAAAEPEWAILDSVGWAGGQAPDLGFASSTSSRPSSSNGRSEKQKERDNAHADADEDPFVEASGSKPSAASTPHRPFPGLSTNGQGSAAAATPPKTSFTPNGKGPSFSFGGAKKLGDQISGSPTLPGAPSNYEITMMRLKEAERKRLEAQIREEEAQVG